MQLHPVRTVAPCVRSWAPAMSQFAQLHIAVFEPYGNPYPQIPNITRQVNTRANGWAIRAGEGTGSTCGTHGSSRAIA